MWTWFFLLRGWYSCWYTEAVMWWMWMPPLCREISWLGQAASRISSWSELLTLSKRRQLQCAHYNFRLYSTGAQASSTSLLLWIVWSMWCQGCQIMLVGMIWSSSCHDKLGIEGGRTLLSLASILHHAAAAAASLASIPPHPPPLASSINLQGNASVWQIGCLQGMLWLVLLLVFCSVLVIRHNAGAWWHAAPSALPPLPAVCPTHK